MSALDLTPDELMAAEYVLGLLEPEALLEARGRIASEPEFAAAVEWWESKLAPLLDELGGAEAGPELWARIETAMSEAGARSDGQNGAETGAAGGEVVALRRRVRYWQATAAMGLAASVAALVFALLPLMRAPVTPVVTEPSVTATPTLPPLVAEVPIDDIGQRFAVMWLPERGELLVTAAALTSDGVHDHELWLLADEGAPRSLGVIRPGGVTRVTLTPAIAALIRDGSSIAVSREPLGGKPPNADLGPVVAQGTLART
jgi:anti-sigma-K factor RskA